MQLSICYWSLVVRQCIEGGFSNMDLTWSSIMCVYSF